MRKLVYQFLNPDPNKNLRVIPMISASYDPDNGFGAGAFVDFYFRLNQDSTTPLSYVSVPFYMSMNRQMVVGATADLYFGSKYRLFTSFRYIQNPTPYYGVYSRDPVQEKEIFQHNYYKIQINALREVKNGFYLGGNYFFQKSQDIEFLAGGSIDFSDATGKEGYTYSGAGLSAQYDTRDKITSPYSGVNLTFRSTFFAPFLGSDNFNTGLSFSISNYQQIKKSEHIIALQLGGDFFTSEPPFALMNTFGNGRLMRGYRSGKYLDRNRVYTQAEYRFPIFWRFRGAIFGGLATVNSNFQDFQFNDLKFAGGGGLRLVVDEKERLSLRFDVASSFDGGYGFYFSVNEAF